MKVAIVKSKDVDFKCTSSLRYLHRCRECKRVMRCKLPEAKAGKIGKINMMIAKYKSEIDRLEILKEAILNGVR